MGGWGVVTPTIIKKTANTIPWTPLNGWRPEMPDAQPKAMPLVTNLH